MSDEPATKGPKEPVVPIPHETIWRPGRQNARIPRVDPEKWEAQPVFRETFLRYVSDPEDAAAFRAFSRTQYALALAGCGVWDDTYAEAEAEMLRAVLADLRHLQGLLTTSFEAEVDTLKRGLMTPRKEHLYRFTGVLAGKISALADEIERKILESLQEDDDEGED